MAAMSTLRLSALAALLLGCGNGTPVAQAQPTPAPTATKPVPPAVKKKPAPKPSPCTTPVHGQFDFWVGSWSVRGPKGKLAGRNRIEKRHRGCALVENWTSVRGGTGMSTNYWDPGKKKWVQNWVDGTGGIIQLEGGLEGKAMKLDGRYVKANGTVTRLRGTWTPLADGRVRQLFEESKDGGKSWTIWFDGYYTRVATP
jgi:hypothetical protein